MTRSNAFCDRRLVEVTGRVVRVGWKSLDVEVELTAEVRMIGRSSVRIGVDLCAADLIAGKRRQATTAPFTMVGVDTDGRPQPFGAEIAPC